MISAIILTKNEEKNIKDCLGTLRWCDEILIIDDNSTDKTREIAQRLGARILTHPLSTDFAAQRNFGLREAKGEWVLFIDADERVSESLAFEISNIIRYLGDQRSNLNGFYIHRKDTMWGDELRHGETRNIRLLRLAKKNSGIWEGRVHETWRVKGKIGDLKNSFVHYPHQSLSDFLKEINFYTDIRANELFERGVSTNSLSVIIYPKVKFFVNYILKLGFLDGMAGLVFAILMSFHSFLVRGKLWLLWQKK